MPVVLVPAERVERWVDNFAERHGGVSLGLGGGALIGTAPDGSHFSVRLPFSQEYGGPADASAVVAAIAPPERWGVLLVRKGGFAVARMQAAAMAEHKVGQRHVQGRTKAGGQSQQRFARRRDNQARAAFDAATDHAARILGGVGPVVAGGDRVAVDRVLADPRLDRVEVVGPWLAVPDPRRAVLDRAVADAQAAVVEVVNAPPSR